MEGKPSTHSSVLQVSDRKTRTVFVSFQSSRVGAVDRTGVGRGAGSTPRGNNTRAGNPGGHSLVSGPGAGPDLQDPWQNNELGKR